MLDNFGLALAEPVDFEPHRALVGRVHDGISKATAHLTYHEANDFFDSARDYIPALNELVRVDLRACLTSSRTKETST